MGLLIRNGYVVTMNPSRDVFDGGYVAIDDEGRVAAVGPRAQCPRDFRGDVADAGAMIVLPGLINAHQHHWQNLLMGLQLPAGPIGAQALRAFAARHLSPDDQRVSASLAAMTMVGGGTTCVLNHVLDSSDEEGVAATIGGMREIGLRQVQALDFRSRTPALTLGRHGVDEEAARLSGLVGRWHGPASSLVRLALAVESSAVAVDRGTACEEQITAAYRLAVQRDLKISSLTSSAADAGAPALHEAIQRSGRPEVLHLMELGVLDARWLLAGGELLSSTDVMLMRESGCSAVYTPLTESLRGRGWGPWSALQRAGVTCALGTDGPALHCGADMVEQIKASVLVQNTVHLDATAMSSEAALEMATLGAARALGLDAEIGSLEPGKRADVAVFDLRGVQMQVAHKPISVFVACAGASDAWLVTVNGKIVVRDGSLVAPPDVDALIAHAQRRARSLQTEWLDTPSARN